MLPIDATEVLVPLAFFVFLAGVIITPMVLRNLRQQDVQRTLRLAIEKGQTLDPKLIEHLMETKQRKPKEPDNDLRGGVVTLFVAAGLAVFGFVLDENTVRPLLAIAALVALIGLGQIAAWALRRKPRAEAAEEKAAEAANSEVDGADA